METAKISSNEKLSAEMEDADVNVVGVSNREDVIEGAIIEERVSDFSEEEEEASSDSDINVFIMFDFV
jgi:hypothetical protein